MKFVSVVLASASLLVSSLAAQAGKIVYINTPPSSGGPRAESIMIMNDDGTDQRTIIRDDKWHGFPVLSYDNQHIAFLSHDSNNKPQIFIANVDGTNMRQLTDFPNGAWGPSWSPNGKKIAFMALNGTNSPRKIFTINSDGTDLTHVIDLATGQPPIWSPDGKKLLFANTQQLEYVNDYALYTVSPDGTDLRQLTTPAYLRGWSWSPDGKVCYSYRVGSLHKIALLNADGSGYQEIAASTEKRFEWCNFLENGRIVFHSSENTYTSTAVYSLSPNSINPYAIDLRVLTQPGTGASYGAHSAFNIAPVAENQSVETSEDTSAQFTLNATDSNDDPIEYLIVSPPQHGTLSGTGINLSYTPHSDYSGTDTFSYQVSDGKLNSKTATVSISVQPVNDAPVAHDDNVYTDEDTPVQFTLSGSDADDTNLSFVITSSPANGKIKSLGFGEFLYEPNTNFSGTDSLQYKVFDGKAYSQVATVYFHVKSANDAPVVQEQSVSTSEDQSKEIVLLASDIDSIELIYTVVSSPQYGVLTGSGANLTYTPNKDYNGTDSFAFQASDGAKSSNVATVNISISAVNDAPVATADNYILNTKAKKAPKQLTVLAPGVLFNDSDVEGSQLTATLVLKPTIGKLTFNPNGSFVYKPVNEKKATYTFTYRVSDGKLQSAPVTVTIAVNPN
jgi:Tol biopolymer transport system component